MCVCAYVCAWCESVKGGGLRGEWEKQKRWVGPELAEKPCQAQVFSLRKPRHLQQFYSIASSWTYIQ